jgi:hypothetical protein
LGPPLFRAGVLTVGLRTFRTESKIEGALGGGGGGEQRSPVRGELLGQAEARPSALSPAAVRADNFTRGRQRRRARGHRSRERGRVLPPLLYIAARRPKLGRGCARPLRASPTQFIGPHLPGKVEVKSTANHESAHLYRGSPI